MKHSIPGSSRTRRSAAWLLAGLAATTGACGTGATSTKARIEPPQVVDGQNDAGVAFMKAFRENDPEAIGDLYAADAVYYSTDTMAVYGSDAIRANFRGFFDAFEVLEAGTSEVRHVTFGDLSVQWGKWYGTVVPRQGGEPIRFEGRFTDLSRLVDGEWTYLLDHASFPITQ